MDVRRDGVAGEPYHGESPDRSRAVVEHLSSGDLGTIEQETHFTTSARNTANLTGRLQG